MCYLYITDIFDGDVHIEKLIYKDFQTKNYQNIPSSMQEGYNGWLKNIKVKQLEKEIKEGVKE